MTSNLPTTAPNFPEDAGQSRFRLMLASLAREMVMELEAPAAILLRKQITNIQYERIQKNPYYVKIFTEASEAWNAASNAEQRTRIQAAFLLEQALPGYFVRITEKTEPLSSVTEGMKFLARTAGIGEARVGSEGGKFVISINLGNGQKLLEHEVKTIDQPPMETTNGNSQTK